jgi:hypothetical protein
MTSSSQTQLWLANSYFRGEEKAMAKRKPTQRITRMRGTRNQYRVETSSGDAWSHRRTSKVVKGKKNAERVADSQMARHKGGSGDW